MDFVFHKLRTGKYDRLSVIREGRAEDVLCPKIGGIPHDMVHFAVENVMGRRGYLRRVSGGEKLTFRMAGDIESDQMERLVEVLQADRLSGYPAAADLIAMYGVTCDARGVEPYTVTEDDIAALRTEIARLEVLWMNTEPGAALTLRFDNEPTH